METKIIIGFIVVGILLFIGLIWWGIEATKEQNESKENIKPSYSDNDDVKTIETNPDVKTIETNPENHNDFNTLNKNVLGILKWVRFWSILGIISLILIIISQLFK